MGWEHTVFGTTGRPRYGSGLSIGVLAVVGLLSLLIGSLVVAILFWLLAAGAVFVRSVRRVR